MTNRPILNHFAEQLAEIHHGKLWMGDTFARKLATLTEEEAFVRPLPALHSAAELIAHLTAWRKDAILKITTGTGQLTEDSQENWPDNDTLAKVGWPQLLQDHQESLSALLDLLQNQSDDFLEKPYYDQGYKAQFDYTFFINGLLHHDLYHLGQLGIVIKLLKEGDGTPQKQ